MKIHTNSFSIEDLYELLNNYIIEILNSHRKTSFFQLEVENYTNFEKNQLLESISRTEIERQFISEQFLLEENQKLDWNVDLISVDKVTFLPKNTIVNQELIHFKFSLPIVSIDDVIVFIKVVYQSGFNQRSINGSNCIEMFKKDSSNKYKNIGHLFGMSI
ncbi:MAG: hypothetical protein U0U67_10170 [Chitinophagales bacterium]